MKKETTAFFMLPRRFYFNNREGGRACYLLAALNKKLLGWCGLIWRALILTGAFVTWACTAAQESHTRFSQNDEQALEEEATNEVEDGAERSSDHPLDYLQRSGQRMAEASFDDCCCIAALARGKHCCDRHCEEWLVAATRCCCPTIPFGMRVLNAANANTLADAFELSQGTKVAGVAIGATGATIALGAVSIGTCVPSCSACLYFGLATSICSFCTTCTTGLLSLCPTLPAPLLKPQ